MSNLLCATLKENCTIHYAQTAGTIGSIEVHPIFALCLQWVSLNKLGAESAANNRISDFCNLGWL